MKSLSCGNMRNGNKFLNGYMRAVSVHLWNQRIFETLCSNHQSPYHIAGVVVLRIEEHQLIK
jgi:hypothetical protein